MKEKEWKLPKSISVCGLAFQIVEKPVVCKGDAGITRGAIYLHEGVIEIDETMPDDRKAQVLIHELLHAICDVTGNSEINADEKAIQSIATALYCVIKENNLFSLP